MPWSSAHSDEELHRMKENCDIMSLAQQYDAEELGQLIMDCRALEPQSRLNYDNIRNYLNKMHSKQVIDSSLEN